MPRLDLDPGRAAAAGVVRRVEALDDDALLAVGDRLVEERLRRLGGVGDQPARRGVLGHDGVEPVEPLARWAPRSASRPRGASRSKKNGRMPVAPVAGRRSSTRSPGTAAGGRPRRARSPRRRGSGRSAARERVAATTSGSRAEISSRLRVNTATSSPCLCTWMRMPSSLVSTANSAARPSRRPPARRAPTPASIGRTGRPTTMLNSASAAAPPVSAATAIGPVGALNIAARRTAVTGRSAAAGDRVEHHRVERALAHVAGDQVAEVVLLGGGEPAEQRGDRRRGARRPTRTRRAR